MNPKYLATKSPIVELVVDGKLLDETRTCFLASIGTFFLSVKIISNEKECEKGITKPMPHFGNNPFSEFKERECKNDIIEMMSCFGSNTFSKSNKKVQHITQISIQELISCFTNNAVVFRNNLVSPLNINVGPSLPFHPLHFIIYLSTQVAPRVQKINRSTRNLVSDKIRRMNKEKAERLS